MIAVSDYDNDRIKLMDKKGALIRCSPYQKPSGILIIPSLNLLAVSSYAKYVIDIFDLSYNNSKGVFLYTIGKEEVEQKIIFILTAHME